MLTGVIVLAGAVAVAGFIALYRRRTDGRFRRSETYAAAGARTASDAQLAREETMTQPTSGRADRLDPAELLDSAELGTSLGTRATVVQFSSSFCAPCRSTRILLADVTGRLDEVKHVEIDAESHLELVRRLNILRTPTVLILDRQGRIVERAAGVPSRQGVLAALAIAAGETGNQSASLTESRH